MQALSLGSALVWLGGSAAAMAAAHHDACAKICDDRTLECLDEAYAAGGVCLDRARSNEEVDACELDLRIAEERCRRAAAECLSRCERAAGARRGKPQ